MTYGPSANRLMTAEEYARLDRIRAHAMLSSVERTCPAWTDTTTPRTDAPVRFVAHAARPDYRTFRGVSGLSSHVVRLPA